MTKSRKPRIFRSYSENQKKRIIDLYNEVNNARVVSDELSIPYSSTASIIREYKNKEKIQVEKEVSDTINKSIDDLWGVPPIPEGSASPEATPIKEVPGIEDVLTQLNSIKEDVDSIRKVQKQFHDVCIEQFEVVNNAFLNKFEDINYVIRNNIVEFNERVIKQVKYSSDRVAKEVKGVKEKIENLGSVDTKVMRQFNVFEEKIKSIMNSRTVVTAKESEQKRSLFESLFPTKA